MASFARGAIGWPTKFAPISALSPRPKSVSARPVATWFEASVSVSTPKSPAVAAPGGRAGQHRQGRAAGERHGRECRDGADQHHAFDTEVQHPGPLGDELAQGREQQRRRGGDDGHEERDENGHGLTAFGFSRESGRRWPRTARSDEGQIGVKGQR